MSFVFRFLIVMILFKALCFAELPPVTIGVVVDGKEIEESNFIKGFETETLDLLSAEFNVSFQYFYGSWSPESSKLELRKALIDPTVNIVVVTGGFASDAALHLGRSPKPVIVPAMVVERLLDPTIDSKKYFEEHNVVVVKYVPTQPTSVQLFYEAAPFKKVAIVAEESMIDPKNIKDIKERIQQRVDIVGAETVFYPVTENVWDISRKLAQDDVDAVIILPTWRLPNEELQRFMAIVNEKRIPSFSFMGEQDLKLGVMMTTVPKSQGRRITRRLALNIQEILLNGKNADIAYAFPEYLEIVINQVVADLVGIHPSWEFLSDVRFVNVPKPPTEDIFTLCESAELAIHNNLDLNAERFFVKSGGELVRRARSFLGPQINSKLEARFIDADRARLAAGSNPQRTLRGGLELKQQIYDEDLRADYSIEKWLQNSRVYNLDSLRLDITFGATVSYLEVLKVRAEEKISKENLELSRINLKRARDRVDSGEANKSEVYRWESEIARNQDTLFGIQARMEIAETEYNRILNRRLETPVLIKDMESSDPNFIFNLDQISRYLDNHLSIQLFKECMIALGRFQSPEIRSIDNQLGAQARRLLATKRAFYVPKVFLCGEIEDILFKDGAGRNYPMGTKADNFDSTLTIDMQYPIYTFGRRYADRNKASYDLSNLAIERQAVIQRVDQSVINSIDNMKASYLGIYLARRAAEAAEKNLRIVGESYSRGVVSIVDLIDAQNNALVSRIDASNAMYDFLIDMMSLQRSTGRFACFMTPDELQCIIGECNKYMEKMNRKHDYDYQGCCYE